MIQSGFQGLTEGKQAGCEGERATEGDGEERATDLFDGKLQRCLEDERTSCLGRRESVISESHCAKICGTGSACG